MIRLILTLFLLNGCLLGCAGADDEAAVVEQGESPATTPEPVNVDMKGYPMPIELEGESLVCGAIAFQLSKAGGTVLPEAVTALADGHVVVTIRSLPVNCCTESIRAGVKVEGATASVHLYEYLPDMCECFRPCDVEVSLDLPGEVKRVVVFTNGSNDIRASAVIE